jgi:putative ABC transport system permease protein
MLSPRWRKVLADLRSNKARTVLVVLSIAVGVFAIGMVGGSNVMMADALHRTYRTTNPASAQITTVDPFGDELLEAIARMRAVGEAEGRRVITVRAQAGAGRWRTLQLTVLRDYADIRVNKVWKVSGAWPPPDRTVLVERSSMGFLRAAVGDSLLIELPNGRRRRMPVAGVAHDLGQISTTFMNVAYGYIPSDTVEWLGEPYGYNQVFFTVASHPEDKAHIERVTRAVRDKIEKAGYAVALTYVPDPFEHWSEDVGRAMFLILTVLGVMSLALSGFLVVNTITALMTAQIRQVGIMKAVGARAPQIVGMYLVGVLAFGMLALIVAVPLGILGAHGFAAFTAAMLNFDVGGYRLPAGVLLQQVAAGLLVPLLAALYPVLRGTRISVREAVSDYGLGGAARQGRFDRMMERLRGLSRPMLLALRNTFRRKGRLALTLTTLTLAGAIFIGVISVRDSLLATLEDSFRYWKYDVQVEFSRAYRTGHLERAALRVPGTVKAESWMIRSARRVRPDGIEGNTFFLVGPPPDTALMQPIVLEGRWLLPADENAIVINTDVQRQEPGLRVGDEIVAKVGLRKMRWRVVGLVRGIFSGPMAYATYPYLSEVVRDAGQGERVLVVTEQHDAVYTAEVARNLEDEFRRLGMRISSVQTLPDLRRSIIANMNVLVIFLLIMAVLLAVVGGLGLAGTMSINVLERTREIGVLRAVGAADRAVILIVLVEGGLIGTLSWLVGAILGYPFGAALSAAIGQTMFGSPLTFRYSLGGVVLWLVLVVLLAAFASIVPAWNASRLTVRDVLAYE